MSHCSECAFISFQLHINCVNNCAQPFVMLSFGSIHTHAYVYIICIYSIFIAVSEM